MSDRNDEPFVPVFPDTPQDEPEPRASPSVGKVLAVVVCVLVAVFVLLHLLGVGPRARGPSRHEPPRHGLAPTLHAVQRPLA